MAPVVAALAQSESKERFLARLNFVPNDRRAEELYNMMKVDVDPIFFISASRSLTLIIQHEAELGCERMAADNNALPLTHGARLANPYNPSLANETTKHREILRIYLHATPVTKSIYDLGHDVQSHSTENWIIRWMLWHVCRYKSTQLQYRHTATRGGTRPARTRSRDATESAKQNIMVVNSSEHGPFEHNVLN
nr:hypothetical protein CFP56_00419 [Quercus suber]